MYLYPRNFANKKLKDMTKKFNKLVPLSESKLEFTQFRTQNLCKDHLFHTDRHYLWMYAQTVLKDGANSEFQVPAEGLELVILPQTQYN